MAEILERFNKSWIPEPFSGCWIWSAMSYANGYGKLYLGGGKPNNAELAHRASWRLHCGDIPNGKSVLHRCDTPACVNPDHLFLGTRADNCHDRTSKGRTARGQTHCRAKLTEIQVMEIKNDHRSQYEIASQYGITQGHVSTIKSGKRWGWFRG